MVVMIGTDIGLSIPAMHREWWGAMPPKWTEPLHLPIKYVRLTHTGTPKCVNRAECYETLVTIQNFYMEEIGLPDIPYNFMIGGDGVVYKGRGWYVEPSRPPDLYWLQHKCIDIAFVGDFSSKIPHERTMKRALDLITYGVVKRKIDADYKIIRITDNPRSPSDVK